MAYVTTSQLHWLHVQGRARATTRSHQRRQVKRPAGVRPPVLPLPPPPPVLLPPNPCHLWGPNDMYASYDIR